MSQLLQDPRVMFVDLSSFMIVVLSSFMIGVLLARRFFPRVEHEVVAATAPADGPYRTSGDRLADVELLERLCQAKVVDPRCASDVDAVAALGRAIEHGAGELRRMFEAGEIDAEELEAEVDALTRAAKSVEVLQDAMQKVKR